MLVAICIYEYLCILKGICIFRGLLHIAMVMHVEVVGFLIPCVLAVLVFNDRVFTLVTVCAGFSQHNLDAFRQDTV